MKSFNLLFVCALLSSTLILNAQAPTRKLPQTINRPNVNITAPFISLDGNTLLFTSDYAEDNEPTLYYSQRVQVNWKDPQMLPKHINSKLNFQGGHTLSPDGTTVYISTVKSGGIGGYDIWHGSLKGTSWNDLQNMFLPINSNQHEASPTFTPDGKTMYFMRCVTMTQKKAENCKIMVAKKAANGRWGEPTELPANINTGNSQTPRISSDGEILIFASNVMLPSKGGMDLYATKFINGKWSDPTPLDFVNTASDDQFVSFIANGRYLLKDAPGTYKREIIEYLMPEEWRPPALMKVEGKITNANNLPTPAYISVTDLKSQNRIFSGRPDKDGNYNLYLKEGSRYDLSIDPEQGNFTFFSKIIDMTETGSPLSLKVDAVLKPLQADDELELDGILFKEYSAELDNSDPELRRLSRLMRASPQFDFEIQVLLAGYEEDSIPSTPDLTEISIDTVIVQIEVLDSLGQATSQDSLIVDKTYHNNRTESQAKAIIDGLVTLGADSTTLKYFVNVRPEPIEENRRVQVRLAARKKK